MPPPLHDPARTAFASYGFVGSAISTASKDRPVLAISQFTLIRRFADDAEVKIVTRRTQVVGLGTPNGLAVSALSGVTGVTVESACCDTPLRFAVRRPN